MKINALLTSLVILSFVMAACMPPTSEQPESIQIATETVVESLPPPDIAILIVDDFGEGRTSSMDFQPGLGDTCIMTPNGQAHTSVQGLAHTSVQGLDMGDEIDNPPHGELVYTDLRNEIYNFYGYLDSVQLSDQSDDIYSMEQFNTKEGNILLVKVDTLGYTTSIIGARLTNAVAALENQFSIDRFVVNMSFGIIPCNSGFGLSSSEDLYNEYLYTIGQDPTLIDFQDDLDSLDNYEALALNNTLDVIRLQPSFIDGWLSRSYGSIPDSNFDPTIWPEQQNDLFGLGPDPLFSTLEELAKRNIIMVASAGNYGAIYNFPFAPAIWDPVLAVGASLSESDPNFYSNPGEVAMNPDCRACMDAYPDLDPAAIPYAPVIALLRKPYGTSFSAPKLSFLAALYLLRGGSATCAENENAFSTSPPLAYAPFYAWWVNLDIETATVNYCDVFPTSATPITP